MDSASQLPHEDDPESTVLRALLFTDALTRGNRDEAARQCIRGLEQHLADCEGRFEPETLARAYRQLARYSDHAEEWESARHAAEKFLLLRGLVPLEDREYLDMLVVCSRASFELGDMDRAEALAVDVLARTKVIEGAEADGYRIALGNLITVREHKTIREAPRRATRNTEVHGDKIRLTVLPDPMTDLVAAFHGLKSREVAGEASSSPIPSSRFAAIARPAGFFLLCILYVYTVAAMGDLAATWVFNQLCSMAGIASKSTLAVACAFATMTLTVFVGNRVGFNVANLQTPFVIRIGDDQTGLGAGGVTSVRLDLRAWFAGTIPAAGVLAAFGSGAWIDAALLPGLAHPKVSALAAGVACGWLGWPLWRYGVNSKGVEQQLATGDFALLLRRFGSSALYRLRDGRRGMVAVFDPSRRDYWSPVHLVRMFFNRDTLDYVQVALRGADWYGAVMSLAVSARAVAYDMEGYGERPTTGRSGLMMETELYLFLDKPVAFLARRRDSTVPAWLPTPLLVLTKGRSRREIAWQLAKVMLGRFDDATKIRLAHHRALVQAELDHLRELVSREQAEPGTLPFNPLAALLARDQWTPQVAWTDDPP